MLVHNVNYYRMVLFMIFLGGIHKMDSVTINVFRKEPSANFVEDEVTTFICDVQCRTGSCNNIKATWLLLDPVTDHELFFGLKRYEVHNSHTDINGMASFPVLMRRDFSHKQVMCITELGTGSFIMPEIKKTIDVEAVVLKSPDAIPNEKVTLRCDVKAPVGKVRQVMFQNFYGRLPAVRNETIDNGWQRYYYVSNVRVEVEKNGTMSHCMAITKGRNSPKGIVVSEMRPLIIHYFKFLSTKSPWLSKKRIALFSATIKASPYPKANSFINHCKHPNGSRWSPPTKQITILKTGKDNFNITMEFYHRDACHYSLQFKSHMVNTESESFFIDKIRVTYESPFIRRGPIIKKGDILDLSFLLFSNFPLTIGDLQVFFSISKTGTQIVCPLEESQSKISPLPHKSRGRRDEQYFVRLALLPPSSGTYRVLFNASGILFNGPTINVGFSNSEISNVIGCFIAMIVIIPLVICPCWWIFLRLRTYISTCLKERFFFVSFPNGQKYRYKLRPEVTVQDVINFARKENPDYHIRNLQHRGEYMTRCNNWRWKRLQKDWNVQPNEEIRIIPRSSHLRLLIRNPFGVDEPRTLELYDEEVWADVKERFAREYKQTIGDEGIAFSEAGFYSREGRQRLATKCYVASSTNYFKYFDTETGKDGIDESEIEQKVARLLHNNSLLPHSAERTPNISIRKALKLFAVNQCWRLQPLKGVQALWDSSFVLFFGGILVGSSRSEKFFWLLENGNFFDGKSGEMFEHEKSLPKYEENIEKTCFYVLVKNGQHPPLLRIPEGKHLTLYKRTEINLDIDDGKVCAARKAYIRPQNTEEWESVSDDFANKFNASFGSEYPSRIFIQLPSGKIIEQEHNESLTVDDVINCSRRADNNLTIGNVLWNNTFLTGCALWREKRLIGDWHVKQSDIIRVSPSPKKLFFIIEDPSGQIESLLLTLMDSEETWEDVLSTLKISRPDLEPESVFVYTKAKIYEKDGERNAAVRCKEDDGKYFDKENGSEIDTEKSICTYFRYLHETSLLPDIAVRTPIIYVCTKTDFFHVEDRKWKPISRKELWNTNYKLLLEGIQCIDSNRMFWRLQDGTFFDGSDLLSRRKKTFLFEDIPYDGKKRHAFLLLKEEDKPPYLCVPDKKFLAVNHRLEASKRKESSEEEAEASTQSVDDVQRWERAETTGVLAKKITAQALSSETQGSCVYLHLPNGVHRRIFSTSCTAKDVMKVAHFYDPTLRISDILRNKMSITRSENWDSKVLKLEPGDDLKFRSRSPDILLSIRSSSEIELLKKLFILDEEETTEDLFKAIRERLPWVSLGERTIAFSEVDLYGEKTPLKKALLMYDAWSDHIKYVDDETGEEVKPEQIVRKVDRVLRKNSLLPTASASGEGTWRIQLYTDMDIFKMSGLCLEKVDRDYLLREEFFVTLMGIKTDSKFYWRLHSHEFCDGEGNIAKATKDIQKANKARYIIVLLKESDRPPKVPVPDGQWLYVKWRKGAEPSIKNGIICGSKDMKVEDNQSWESDTKINRFQNDITDAAKR